ncbi:hypothetical protein ACJX0J_002601 [Zea mays]
MTHINYLMENTKNPVIEKKRYELHNDKNNSYFIFIINYNEMHFNESLYTLINMIPHIRGGDKKEGKIQFKYNIREFPINIGFLWNSINQLRNKRKVKLFNLFLKIHNSSIFYFSYFNRFGESETILFYRKIEL